MKGRLAAPSIRPVAPFKHAPRPSVALNYIKEPEPPFEKPGVFD